jgi:hypothetical protein
LPDRCIVEVANGLLQDPTANEEEGRMDDFSPPLDYKPGARGKELESLLKAKVDWLKKKIDWAKTNISLKKSQGQPTKDFEDARDEAEAEKKSLDDPKALDRANRDAGKNAKLIKKNVENWIKGIDKEIERLNDMSLANCSVRQKINKMEVPDNTPKPRD